MVEHRKNNDLESAINSVRSVLDIVPLGGYCYIVVEDLNVDDDSIDFCLWNLELDTSWSTDEKDIQRECLQKLLALPEASRIPAILAADDR